MASCRRPDALPRSVWSVRLAQGVACSAVSGGHIRYIEVLPRSVWRVRWAQGGVCPAVSERYNRGGGGAFAGMAGGMLWQWKQSGHRSGKAKDHTKGGPRRRPRAGVGGLMCNTLLDMAC